MTPADIDILTVTVAALAEPVKSGQLVGFDGGPTGADERVLGVAKHAADTGRPLAVTTFGLIEVKAAGAIAAGDFVYSDADGNPTATGTENPFGIAFQGGGAGDWIAILLK